MSLFPKVTTSTKEFSEWVSCICEKYKHLFSDELTESWIKAARVKEHSHYFYGVIYVTGLSFHIISHEFIHHVASRLRYWTASPIWYYFDDWNDKLNDMRDNLLERLLGR